MHSNPARSIGGAPLLLWLLLCLALLLGVTNYSVAQTENSPRSSTDWKARYYSLAQKVLKLETAWNSRQIDYETLKRSFRELEASHQILQGSLTASEKEVARLTPLSETLLTRFDEISAQIQEVEKTAQAAIRRAWITGVVVGIPVGAAVAELVRWVLTLIFG